MYSNGALQGTRQGGMQQQVASISSMQSPVKALFPRARACSWDCVGIADGMVEVRLLAFKNNASKLLPAKQCHGRAEMAFWPGYDCFSLIAVRN